MASKMSSKTCPICHDELENARMLPCIHSFCLDCLEQYCRSGCKVPGDDVPCPECRTEFQVPKNGVGGLSVVTREKETTVPTELCEACSSDDSPGIPATVYCVDCRQKLCTRCSLPHKRMRGGPHDVRSLDEVPPQVSGSESYCEEHRERLRMYCFDCRVSVCSMCCHEDHKHHDFERIEKVLESFDDAISPISTHINRFRDATAQLERENNKFLDAIKAVETDVMLKSNEIRQLFDRQKNNIHGSLEDLKLSTEKEVKSRIDRVQFAVSELESFKTNHCSLILRSKSSRSEIEQSFETVRLRAQELLQRYVVPGEYSSPGYKFIPVDIDELFNGDQNIIGDVVKDEDTGAAQSTIHLQTVRERELEQRVFELTRSESNLQDELQQLKLRLDTIQSAPSTPMQHARQQGGCVDSFQQAFLSSPTNIVQKISTGGYYVRGMTAVGDELFVLRYAKVDQLDVYSVGDYQPVRHLSLPGFEPDTRSDMTSCVQYNRLYISDPRPANLEIDVFDLASSRIAKWKVSGSPCGLSVTPSSCNLLVTCQGSPNQLIELSGCCGQCIREIPLQCDIEYPWHGVQLTVGQYVVCGSGTLHRVCVIDVGLAAILQVAMAISRALQSASWIFRITWPRMRSRNLYLSPIR